ncbi:MAG TPA: DMT family transporter [Burkholderiales bacterium]|nr:DMT family transporter [Burkholderiales bacterium]
MTKPNRWAFAALLAGGCAIALAPVFVRWSDTGPVASAFWRLALAIPLLWLWLAFSACTQVRTQGKPISHLNVALLAGLFFAADLGVWHWSINYTTVANATLLTNFAPIFVTLGSWWLCRERISAAFFLGMTVALGGAMLLVGPDFELGGTRLLGDGLGLLTAVFYAGYMLSIKQARNKSSTAMLMAWSTTIGAAALLPVALLSPQPFLPEGTHGWLVLLGLALVSQIVGQGLITYAFAHLPATLSSVSLLIQPVVATLLGWTLFDETLGPSGVFGGVLVLTGIYLAKRSSNS